MDGFGRSKAGLWRSCEGRSRVGRDVAESDQGISILLKHVSGMQS